MDIREQMCSGELYDANFNQELIEERTACKVKCQQYNTMPYKRR